MTARRFRSANARSLIKATVVLGLPIASGVLLAWSLPPQQSTLGGILGLCVWSLVVTCSATNKSAFGVAAVGGFAFHVMALDVLRSAASGPRTFAGPFLTVWCVLVVLSTLWWGLLGSLLWQIARRVPCWIALPLIWTSGEFVQCQLLTLGFGVSNALVSLSLTPIDTETITSFAGLAGASGVTFVFSMIAGALSDLIETLVFRRSTGKAVMSIVSFVIVAGMVVANESRRSWDVSAESQRITVGIIPAKTHEASNVHFLRQWSLDRGLDLVIWPEMAHGEVISTDDQAASLQELKRLFQDVPCPVLVGCARHESRDIVRIWNSVLLIEPNEQAPVQSYDKWFLTPGVEVSLGGRFQPALSSIPFSRGVRSVVFSVGRDTPFAAGICHDICHSEWCRSSVMNGNRTPHFLVHCADESLDRAGQGAARLLACARLRAIEANRPIVRCVRNGHSAVIDSSGRLEFLKSDVTCHLPDIVTVDTRPQAPSVYHKIGGDRGVGCGLSGLWLGVLGSIWQRTVRRKKRAATELCQRVMA